MAMLAIFIIYTKMQIIKLKTILESIQAEANMSGKRSSGITKWDSFVVNDFDPNKVFKVAKEAFISSVENKTNKKGKISRNWNKISQVSVGDEINILNPEITKVGSSNYATVRSLKDGTEGLLKLSVIQKPTSEPGVLGGKQSKSFTPNNLGLNGKTFSSAGELADSTKQAIESKYTGAKFDTIKKYAYDCMSAVYPTALNEVYSEKINLKNKYPNIEEQDINTLSKNFGEVLAAIYILQTNKKADYLKFAPKEDTPFYDFFIKSGEAPRVGDEAMEKGKIFYSVKSHGGSSTSVENLNFLLNNYSKIASIRTEYENELAVINSLMNDKLAAKTTVSNIEKFFNTHFPEKEISIINKLNSIVVDDVHKIKTLSQPDLDKWFEYICGTVDIDTFASLMEKIYNEDLTGSKAERESLVRMHKSKNSKHNGYLYYPMGAYIVRYLNSYKEGNSKPYIDTLNMLLNYGSFVQQFDVDLEYDSINITIESFVNKNFRFSYNGLASNPGNRPIGFKTSSGSSDV
jgi:hypothetical protein